MGRFSNIRTALVTGAGGGLGGQLVRDLLAEGVAVAGIDHRREGMEALAKEVAGQRFAWELADVADATQLTRQVRLLEAKLGPIDLLIANAGVGYETSMVSGIGGDVPAMMRINLEGVWNSVDAVVAGMMERRRGHIAAISSLASYRGMPKMLGYCASKAGVNALMDGLRVELHRFDIGVTIVCPGYINTAMVAANEMPMPHLLEPGAASTRILWAIERRKAFHAFPWQLAWRLRLLKLLPRVWQDRVIRRWVK